MNLEEYARYDALGLAEFVKRREVSPRELAETALKAIEAVNPKLHAVIEIYDDRIAGLDSKTLDRGPFRGVPFLIKDVGPHLKGRKTEFCSRLCQGMVGEVDSNFATLLKASGVNILGRTNTPEFSMASSAENLLYGSTSTPWKLGYSASGSTGGGAAAVSAGVAPMAHGSDIGGSIRGPAAWCGGIGLKPSRGRISSGPLFDEWGYGMAMNFVQTKTMRDTAAMLDCLAIPQPGDPFVIKSPPKAFAKYLKPSGKPCRIAWSATALMDTPVDPEIATAVRKTAEVLAELGHQVEEAAPPLDLPAIDDACMAVWFFAFDRRLDGYARKTGREVGPDTVEAATLRFYEFAKSVPHTRFLDALAYMNKVRRDVGAFFTRYDVWLTPTTAQPAPRLGVYNMNVDLPPKEFIAAEERSQQFMVIYNVTGQPAISLPLAMHSTGLPIGVQLAARPAEDHLLIELGAMLEDAMPWRERKPPIHVASS
ncbi:MAG: amidase [Rhodospirillaceae bacterium]|nr:amidase [Rhodospirillaceae bacterium]